MARFKKGESGNPKGRPKVPDDVKRCKAVTNEEIRTMADLILVNGTRSDLARIMLDQSATPLQAWIASIVLKGIQRGDVHALNQLLDRLIGKVTENIRHVDPVLTIIERPSGGETVLGVELLEKKEKE